jgi:hypothetical protein
MSKINIKPSYIDNKYQCLKKLTTVAGTTTGTTTGTTGIGASTAQTQQQTNQLVVNKPTNATTQCGHDAFGSKYSSS